MDFFLTRDPLQLLLNLPEESEKHLNAPTRTYVRDTKAMASTAVDVKELPKAFVFVADMPGLKSSDVQVQLENNDVLVISGERKEEDKPEEDVKYLRVERRPTKFMRKFTLPNNANLDGITASCTDGVLTVTVPKVPPPELHKTRTINVSAA